MVSCMINDIYTVGYTSFTPDQMIEILKKLSIGCLIDVRSVPASSYAPQYNQAEFSQKVQENGIYYRNYKEFGARQSERRYYTEEGYLDFERYVLSEGFLLGKRKVLAGMELNYRFVLMCAEKDPLDCHRAIMVARPFSEEGFRVKHLLPHETDRRRRPWHSGSRQGAPPPASPARGAGHRLRAQSPW